MPSPSGIAAAFDLGPVRLVSLIGGGGKTTLMDALANDLVRQGRRVILTTTTRIRHPRRGIVIIEPTLERLAPRLREQLWTASWVTAACEQLADDKLRGLDPAGADHLASLGLADTVLVEADGAAGRSLKAHAAFEPVIPSTTDLVIAVIGIDCIGRPLDDATVHRAERLTGLLGPGSRAVLTPETVASIVLQPDGYLRQVPPDARIAVMLNKADDARSMAIARSCARALARADQDRGSRIERIVAGSLLEPIVHRRMI